VILDHLKKKDQGNNIATWRRRSRDTIDDCILSSVKIEESGKLE